MASDKSHVTQKSHLPEENLSNNMEFTEMLKDNE